MDILTYLTKYNLDTISFAYHHSNELQHLADKYDQNEETKKSNYIDEYYVKILNEYKKLFDFEDIDENKIHDNIAKLKYEYPIKNDNIDIIIKEIYNKFSSYVKKFNNKDDTFSLLNKNKIQFFEKIYNAFDKNKYEMKEFINKSYTHLLYAYIVLKFIIDKVDEIPN